MSDAKSMIAQYWVPAIIAAFGSIIAAVLAVFVASAINDDDNGTAQPAQSVA